MPVWCTGRSRTASRNGWQSVDTVRPQYWAVASICALLQTWTGHEVLDAPKGMMGSAGWRDGRYGVAIDGKPIYFSAAEAAADNDVLQVTDGS